MASEPITLFARLADPAKVARKLRELVSDVTIDGPDEAWSEAVITLGRWWSKKSLTVTHDPDYYAEPNWSVQMTGMQNYIARFPDTERKSHGLMLPTTFRFSLGFLVQPDFAGKDDPRLKIIYELAALLDGVLFTPTSLRDARGRILFGAGGEDDEDPDAIWPKVIAEVSMSEAQRSSAGEVPSENINSEPPDAVRVARRALALTAVTFRAVLERELDNPEAQPTYQELLAWVDAIGIQDELEPDEWQVLQRPLGRLEQQDQVNGTWRLEGLVVLAWALGRSEIPPLDQLVEMNPLWKSLGILDADEAQSLLEHPTLRPLDELVEQRDRMFAIHWRLRNFRLRPETIDFANFATTCWFGPLNIRDVTLLEGDLGLQGLRIDKAEPDIVSAANSTAMERHQAANWLCDGPERYSEASTDT